MNASSYMTTSGLRSATQALRFRVGITDYEMNRTLAKRRHASMLRARWRFLAGVIVLGLGIIAVGLSRSLGDVAHLLQLYVAGFVLGLLGLGAALSALLAGAVRGRESSGRYTAAEIPAGPEDVLWLHQRSRTDDELRDLVDGWFAGPALIRASDIDLVKKFLAEKGKSQTRAAAYVEGEIHRLGDQTPKGTNLPCVDLDLQGA
ncbi:hypothetical protein [Pseudoxanthomonas kaohsiungensis]|uniref:Uncharacterized protein n=1 Tax=Pseudoxanthomonas kaohsiungensis TaxID=283923 RepID=A0ABW3LXR1_9GAMM|nr:hypothetical protein [Pseudoxanthomonas kaohsiungensis]KAF1702841.1 hypothetical protein CSC66_08695 [Pseudoxanthomonas kaohsiungensis]